MWVVPFHVFILVTLLCFFSLVRDVCGFPFVILYLIQVSVAPRLSISEDSGNDPPLAVVLPLLRGWTPLKASHLSRTGHTHTHTFQDVFCSSHVFPAKTELTKLTVLSTVHRCYSPVVPFKILRLFESYMFHTIPEHTQLWPRRHQMTTPIDTPGHFQIYCIDQGWPIYGPWDICDLAWWLYKAQVSPFWQREQKLKMYHLKVEFTAERLFGITLDRAGMHNKVQRVYLQFPQTFL